MKQCDKLPFEVGQMAEAKSFEKGYRGAWFRCKIHEIDQSRGYIRHALEYVDFPDEKRKIKWTKIYQMAPWRKGKQRQLILRPQYPRRYDEIQAFRADGIAEATVGVDDVWKVGDLVDWFTDGCYWAGNLTKILGTGKAEIILLQSPDGEGGSYEVSCEDLRPSLDWNPEDGWRVPSLKEGDNYYMLARFTHQFNQGMNNNSRPTVELLTHDIHIMDKESKDIDDIESPVNTSLSSHISSDFLPALDKSNRRKTRDMSEEPLSIIHPKAQTLEGNDLDTRCNSYGKPSSSDSVASSHLKYASAETAVHTTGEDFCDSAGSLKKLKTSGSLPLNIMFSDSLDAVILDLEELANKVQWLKDILEFGIPLGSDMRPPWKFVEHRASSTPK